jgi:SAM-dependent methyltransferase
MIPVEWKRRLKRAWHVLTQDSPDTTAAVPFDEDSPSGCPVDAIATLASCPVCGHGDRTLVCEFNKFVLMSRPPDEPACRYDYMLCHRCGVVYASRRPVGERYQWLFTHFEETIGRADTGLRSVRKLTLSAFSLTDDDREELRRALQKGVFVSDHLGVSRKDYVPSLLSDRLAVAPHVELLGSLLDLKGSRTLEIRSRSGALSAALTRLYGVRATATSPFEHQRLVTRELYGIPSFPMDFETFVVPEGGPYDLIVSNHFLTHAVQPKCFFAAVHEALIPGGHLYLYHEPDEGEFTVDGRSMFNTLNAFHLQTFDGASLVRALAANRFEVVFQSQHGGSFICLARAAREPVAVSLTSKELVERQRRYAHARDVALVSAPAVVRTRFGSLWQEAADRRLAAGEAEIDHMGRVRLRKVRRG